MHDVDTILESTRHRTLDQLLIQLDSAVETGQGNQTFYAGPFGIICFGSIRIEETESVGQTDEATPVPEWDELALTEFPLEIPFSDDDNGIHESPDAHRQIYIGSIVETEFCSPLLQRPTFPFGVAPPYVQWEVPIQPQAFSSAIISQLRNPMSVDYAADLVDVDVPCIRLLLTRYQEKMIPTFTPVGAIGRSLWERVHIPKMHATLGEILLKGDSDDARCALLFAVLSAASYHLGVSFGQAPSHSTSSWKGMGPVFRQRAKSRLLASLRVSGLAKSKEEYEDMLLAILSMITVCVVSGDMVESYTYLQNAQQFIASTCSPRLLRSTTVRMLHSTFLYLWTLQAKVRVLSELIEAAQAQSALIQVSTAGLDVWDLLVPVATGVDSEDVDDCETNHTNGPIFEQVYSVSEKLFRLISRATLQASRIGNYERGSVRSRLHLHDIPPTPKEISDLENAICSWQDDFVPPEPQSTLYANSSNHDHVRHLFQGATHSALLVYFYRCVRGIDTFAVQPHVERTMLQLELYNQAKIQSGDRSSGICWPAFVAACEALDKDLRHKFSQWFLDETSHSGIRMFNHANVAVKRVWHARDSRADRNLPWTAILQRENILDQLMLS